MKTTSKTAKWLKYLTFVFVMALAILPMTSCDDDDDSVTTLYAVGFETASVSGVGSADEIRADTVALNKYQNQVFEAYCKAIGGTNSENSVWVNGSIADTKADMLKKFNNATLPTAPTLQHVKYSFNIALSAAQSGSGSSQQVLERKTFSNK